MTLQSKYHMHINNEKERYKTIIDREKLMRFNAEGCPSCGNKFELGDPVVLACGSWEGPARLIHEHEAVFDPVVNGYVERNCQQTEVIIQ